MATYRRATLDDLSRISSTAARAFVEDPVMRWLVPDDDDWGPNFFNGPMVTWLGHGEVWCTEDGVAVAVWIPPGRPESPTQHQPGPDEAPPSPELLDKIMALRPALDTNAPDELHWYLQLIGTHPDWQRQGIGADLMAIMFERADAEGLPCYLETETPENVAYYRHHGFEVRTEWDLPYDGPHMWGMFRPVKPSR